MSSSSSSINSELDHERDIYDEDARDLRQHGSTPMNAMNAMNTMNTMNTMNALVNTKGNGGHDFRYAKFHISQFQFLFCRFSCVLFLHRLL